MIEAKTMAEDISSLTLFMGVLFGLLGGFLSDRLRLYPLIVISFGMRAAGLIMIAFASKARFFLFMCFLCLNVGNVLESVMITTLLNKSLSLPIREIMNGLALGFKSIGN